MYIVKYPPLLFHKRNQIPISISIYNENIKLKETTALLDSGLDVPIALPKNLLEGLDYKVCSRQVIRSFDGRLTEYDMTKLTIRIFDLVLLEVPILIAGEVPTIGIPLLKYVNLLISNTEVIAVEYKLDEIIKSFDSSA